MTIHLHKYDLPKNFEAGASVAIDTETMGLNLGRDRLCLVQLSNGDGDAHLVQISDGAQPPIRLSGLLQDKAIEKIFHFARFDLAMLKAHIGPIEGPIFCTKIASKLARTYTDRHGLGELCREFLGIDLSKIQQSSDWGANTLTKAQKQYAARDVLYLHQLKDQLVDMLVRLDRLSLAQSCFAFLETQTDLDLAGFEQMDIFHH